MTNSTNNNPQFENHSAERWTATPQPGDAPVTENEPGGVSQGISKEISNGIPKAAVVAWAAGPKIAPNGRQGKKMRRRTRKIAAALATIFVMSTVGTTSAVAQTSFYKASPYVDNKELVEAGSKSFDGRLAIGEPESAPSAPVAATNLEDAILTGGLSPGKMEMPDMMLAGISGDEMALAAAADDSNPASDSATAQPSQGVQAGQSGNGAPTKAGGDSTVGDLAKSAADENPDGYASPALGGDPEPIMDEYAQAEGGPGGAPDAGQDPAPQTPANVELAGADTGVNTGTDAGAEAPIEPTASDDSSQPEDSGPDEAQPQSEELAMTPPASEKDGSEEESVQNPTDQSVPAGATPEESTTEELSTEELSTEELSTEELSTEELSTEEPSEIEGLRPADQTPDGEPDGASEQAFADPSYTEKGDEEPLADEQPTGQPSTTDPATDEPSSAGGSEEDGGSSELAVTPDPTSSEGGPVPEDTKPIEDDDPSADPATAPPDNGLSDQTPSKMGSEDKGYEEGTNPGEGTDPEQAMYPEEGTDPGQDTDPQGGMDPEEATNPGEGTNPEEDLAASTASINQSSSVQVFADEGSSAEVEATQVAAINTDAKLDRNSISDSSGQSEDGGTKLETNGERAATDKGVGEEQTVAEPTANEDTPPDAEEPAIPDEGQEPGAVAQGDLKDVSQPTGEEPRPANETGQNAETPPPNGTEPEATQPEEPAQEPQAIDSENQQGGTSQNTTPRSGGPREEPANAETTGAKGLSPQDTPSQGATTQTQPDGRQPGPTQQQDSSGSTGPRSPRGQQPDAKPAPAEHQTPRTNGSPNVRKPALPSKGSWERPNPQGTRPGNPGGKSVPQQQAPQQVEDQSFAEPDPPDGEIKEQDLSTPADPPVDEPAKGGTTGLPADVAEGANWTEQTAAPANQQAVIQGQRAARQAVRAQRTAARQAAVPQAGVAGLVSQGYVEPAVEPTAAPTAAPATEQSWEQPTQQTGVNPYAQPTAEPSAAPNQTPISQDTHESVKGAAGEAPDTYVDERSIGTGTVPDSNTYNNPYAAGDTSESYEDPVTAPVDNTYAAPAAAETNPAQDAAIPATAPGYEAQDTGNYGGVQQAMPAEIGPTYRQETQEVSTQVPTQELEPAPQVTNTLVDETSAAPSVGTSQVASPATSGGEAPPTAGTKVQNTTSAITGGGQK